ncbi:MAG: hypothetical protein ABSD13_20590, partial [Candidatus Korobacteraceae bacterium]
FIFRPSLAAIAGLSVAHLVYKNHTYIAGASIGGPARSWVSLIVARAAEVAVFRARHVRLICPRKTQPRKTGVLP